MDQCEILVFLSTPPSRVATHEREILCEWCHSVSIHATLAGGDVFTDIPHKKIYTVSIHATLAGGDSNPSSSYTDQCSFYPRHPRGWRRITRCSKFLSQSVSIHATLAGGDKQRPLIPKHTTEFLSTPPSRVATNQGLNTLNAKVVSIHATLAGGDYSQWSKK